MTTASPRWYDDLPELGDVPDLTPADLYASALRASYRIPALLDRGDDWWADTRHVLDAMPPDERDAGEAAALALVAIDHAACDQWLDSHSAADYLPTSED